jgi:hypothetical protein
LTYAHTSLNKRSHEQGWKGWRSDYRCNDDTSGIPDFPEWLVPEAQNQNVNQPGPAKGHQVETDQRVLTHMLCEAIG